jgi:hypothetical protein
MPRHFVCNHIHMNKLARVRLSGELEGDYVVLERRASGVLRVAPEQSDGLPKVVALTKTCFACPAQWEGTLEDGRTIYARYRGGALSVGIGNDIDEAIENEMSDQALYADYVGYGLDGFMDFAELRAHLSGLLEFRADLFVENEREPSWNPETFDKLFARRGMRAPGQTQRDDGARHGPEMRPSGCGCDRAAAQAPRRSRKSRNLGAV